VPFPFKGDFLRSVAFHYFHPDDVVSGEGTRLNGGRFVPVGIKAVFSSLEEETALREVTSRKSALGGRNQINVGEYPRMTYILSVATHRNLDLAATLPLELAKIVARCLRAAEHSVAGALGPLDCQRYRECRFSVRNRRRSKRRGLSGERRQR
jgi:hypothetical protein